MKRDKLVDFLYEMLIKWIESKANTALQLRAVVASAARGSSTVGGADELHIRITEIEAHEKVSKH